MDFSQLVTAINEVTSKVNSIIQNAKKIFQLPSSTPGRKLVAVWNEADEETQQFDLSNAIQNLNNSNDRIIQSSEITRDLNEFTFTEGFIWEISNTQYENAEIVIEIQEATTGFNRIDIAVADTNNVIYIIEGVESETVAQQPQTPPNTLLVCIFSIFGDVISNPTNPIDGNVFVKKIYYSEVNLTTPVEILDLPFSGNTAFNFTIGDFILKGFNGLDELFDGKQFSIKNSSGDTIILEHNNASSEVKFNFIDDKNYRLKPSEIIYFKFQKPRGIEVIGSNDLNKINAFNEFKFVKKGFDNIDLINFEVGDIFEGWVSEGVYSIHSVWDGTGALNDEASFEHKQTIEY